ncbi:VOC family protein [Croceicoccus sediminis]|uniref:VOC family protein n=1 Tax=Croceicoccus sediminis TaxID=2571150 RepID=UPI00118282F5|nr:VOC family protein [Croceicoccus sediminis]
MIRYAMVGSNKLEEAKKFFDEIFAVTGVAAMGEHPSGGRIYGIDFEHQFFGVVGPFDGKPATAGNGTMIALRMPSAAKVDEIHAKALSLGGSNEGDPGFRGPEEWQYYAAYFRDLDGNKFSVIHCGNSNI